MRWIASSFLISSVSMALLTGCPSREVAEVNPEPVREDKKVIPVEVNRDLDILFVVDNSQSMRQEQASLVANFPRFIEVLQNIEGGLPNVHIGVISTDMGAVDGIGGCDSRGGDNGALQSTPRGDGTCTPPEGAFIIDKIDEQGNRIRNYPENQLAETFSCVAALGIVGCGFEQHLESVRRALEENPSNVGFLRPDAFLAIIFLTDEDDCSTRDRRMFQNDEGDELGPLSSFRCFEFGVACEGDNDPRVPGPRMNCVPKDESPYMFNVDSYVDFIKGLKSDPGKIVVAGIMGDSEPIVVGLDDSRPVLESSCIAPGGDEGAAPPVRLQYFLNQFPQRNTFTTICQDDLRDGLVLVAQLLAKVVGNPCIEANIDTDPNTDGLQYECQVSDVRNPNTANQEETPLAECNDAVSNTPCWRLEATDSCQGESPNGLAIIIERGGVEAPSGTEVQVRCLAAAESAPEA